ncbi:hypothetical protein [Amycolatopsis sp. BJA-103]|uniref:hypothetical protein n=1 Tax=Amycolatopsis sp. BJA-103 TaxID=1911175 RepID=UPI000C7585ED|nr:hypothetical protein [Amycolatopsis sp. BJA-103]AUI59304.1 hypothetical protein BKN51_14475 [Amycolatopsis sp. BJA-103]PNE17252.1 hypothetical protein B1H26_20050 [Amycolatopsis sp. BJA-103]
MKNETSENLRLLLTGFGIDTAKAGSGVDLVIDRFDNWTNKARVDTFGCFTGACCVIPPLAETR